MIFKDKTGVTDIFKVEESELFVTVAKRGLVDLEVLEEDNEWRSFPETQLVGPAAKLIPVPADTSLRFNFSNVNTVTAYKAIAVEETVEPEVPVEPETPVEPEIPVEPPVVEPEPEVPVEPETPVEPEPEVPTEPETPEVPSEPEVPTTPPIQYDYITVTPNDYNSEYWSKGVWIFTDRSGINIPASAAAIGAFVRGAIVNFNADGSQREITEVQVVGANISVWFEGGELPNTLGYPATVSTKVAVNVKPTTPVEPDVSKAAGPSVGMNFASGTFSDNVISKLPGTYDKDYTYPNAATFSRWKSKVKHVRFPIRWERIQPTMNTALDSTESARILAVYDYAAANGMVIVLDLHNYMQRVVNGVKYDIGTSQVSQSAYNDLWVRLVALVGSHKASYGYGIMNEPMGTQGRWTGIAQSVINAIRAVDAKTFIFVNGDAWATPLNWVSANPGFPLKGENLVYEAHLYVDKNAGGSYSDASEQIDPQTGVNRLKPFADWLEKYGLVGVLGEIGWPANRPTARVAIENTLQYAGPRGIRCFGWMGGDWLGDGNVLAMEVNGVPQEQVATLLKYSKELKTHGVLA